MLALLIAGLIAAAGVFALTGDDGSAEEAAVRQALERTFTGDSGDEPLRAGDIEVQGDSASAIVHVAGAPRTVELVKKGEQWLVRGAKAPPGE